MKINKMPLLKIAAVLLYLLFFLLLQELLYDVVPIFAGFFLLKSVLINEKSIKMKWAPKEFKWNEE